VVFHRFGSLAHSYNHSLNLTIEKLVYGGDGLARLPADAEGRSKAVFAPFVLESESVEATIVDDKPSFARAKVDEVLMPSALRVEAPCPYFRRCGGCHYQHTSFEHQLEIKAGILKENLRRIAKLELTAELKVHASPPWNYRNRARLKVRTAPEFAVGYYRFHSHELLAVEKCPISSSLLNRAIAALWELGRAGKFETSVQEIELFADADDKRLLVELYCGDPAEERSIEKFSLALRSALPEIGGITAFNLPQAESPERRRITSAGLAELTYKTSRASYKVSAGSFFQVNRHLIDELVDIVTAGQYGRQALDLYAGVGLFSSVLAGSFAQVTAVESSQTSHADLRYNSPPNVKVVRALTEQYLAIAGRRMQPEFVVVDPPRSGLGPRVLNALAGQKPAHVVYVSCDPATLARDLAGFLKSGYQIAEAHLIDLFPQTYHIESVFHLAR
jgi:23S rRNA (uracil1939-C5)-methyltransferase